MALSVGSLFSGIGGIDLGLERAGFEIAWQCEKDPFCLQVLEKHWPDVKRYQDVREIDGEAERVDLLCGGFPCQPVSCAGKRKGDQDERWLWPEFLRVICCLRPKRILAENVPGLFSADSGRLFGGILRDLAEIGYDAEWQVLSASSFGAPSLRRRLFLVAYPRHTSLEKQRGNAPGSWNAKEAAILCKAGTSPDTNSNTLWEQQGRAGWTDRERPPKSGDVSEVRETPDALFTRFPEWNGLVFKGGAFTRTPGGCWGEAPPAICGVDDGVSRRVDRLRALGNAVVPQVAEYVGKQIIESLMGESDVIG